MSDKQITIRLDPEQLRQVDTHTGEGRNRSAVIRELIEQGLGAASTQAEIAALNSQIKALQAAVESMAAVSNETAEQVAATGEKVERVERCLPRTRDGELLQIMPAVRVLSVEARVAGIVPVTGKVIPHLKRPIGARSNDKTPSAGR